MHARGRSVAGAEVLLGLAAIVLVGSAERYSALFFHSAVDDALISMQYAKNWVLGHGLVFNPGERVEGYTNFLWVVVLAPLYALSSGAGLDFILLVTRVNIGLAVLTLVLVYAIGKQLWGNSLLPTLLALGLCAVDNSYVVWATLGLETHLLTFWMLIAVWLLGTRLETRGIWIGLALTFAQMTRPDAGLFNVVLISGLVAAWLVARKRGAAEARAQSKVLLDASVTWLGLYGAYFLWRYQYYGWLFPNTYYAKVGGDFDGWERGLAYVRSFMSERGWLPALAFAAALVKSTVLRSVTIYLAVHTLYVMWVGGDYFTGHRFFVPQVPLFALALAALLHELMVRTRQLFRDAFEKRSELAFWARAIAACTLAGLLWLLYEDGKQTGPLRTEILEQGGLLRINRNFMGWLSEHKPKEASLATCAIGSAGFDGKFERVVDTCGIIDPVVAHRPVRNFGAGLPGHEKHLTLEETLAKKPTYIDPMGGLTMNYWPHGYYLDASMRLDLVKTVEGIWRRDELRERGAYSTEHAWHFDPGQTGGWSAEGSAFADFPTLARSPKQFAGIGEHGPHANSFGEMLGDLPTGRLMSPRFPLVGDIMVLRVGGGHDPLRLRVALWVDGKPVAQATGLDSEHLSRREWDIRPHRGKLASLEILDASNAPMGHIMVDEVVQWSGPAS